MLCSFKLRTAISLLNTAILQLGDFMDKLTLLCCNWVSPAQCTATEWIHVCSVATGFHLLSAQPQNGFMWAKMLSYDVCFVIPHR